MVGERTIKKIITWGDSFTIGMGMKRDDCYPAILQKKLGEEYNVLNAGSSGENSVTVAARQGAIAVFTQNNVVFSDGKATTVLGNASNNGLATSNGTVISIQGEAFGLSELNIKKVFISGKEYGLSMESTELVLTRAHTVGKLIIPSDTRVTFESEKQQEDSYCQIFYVGANDKLVPTQKEIKILISTYKKMIARHISDCYLVIIPHWTSAYDQAFIEVFGDKAVNFRVQAVEGGLDRLNIFPTQKDIEMINNGKVPVSLLYKNLDWENHLNANGYKLLADCVYKAGKNLGYWN